MRSKSILFALVILLMTAGVGPNATAQVDSRDSWKSFQMGPFQLTGLEPFANNVTYGGKHVIDGVEFEEFELVARTGHFRYAVRGSEDKPLLAGAASGIHIRGLRSLRVAGELDPVLRFEGTDAFTFILHDPELRIPPLLGGRFDLHQPRVWVGNRGTAEFHPGGGSGNLYFNAADVHWEGVQLDLPAPFRDEVVDLQPADPEEGILFEFLLDSGQLQVARGEFIQSGVRPEGKTTAVTIAEPDSPETPPATHPLDHGRIRVSLGSEGASVVLPDFRAPGELIEQQREAPLLATGTIEAPQALAEAARREDAARLGELLLQDPSFDTAVTARRPNEILALDLVAGLVQNGSIGDPEAQRQRAIADSLRQLESLSRMDFAFHLPAPLLRAEVRRHLEEAGVTSVELDLGDQELRGVLDLPIPIPGLEGAGSFRLVVHVFPALRDEELVLRPALTLALLDSLGGAGVVSWTALATSIQESFGEAGLWLNGFEVALPLDLRLAETLRIPEDVAGEDLPLRLLADPVNLAAHVGEAVLLVDGDGIHAAGTLEVTP